MPSQQIMHLIASVRGAMNELMAELVEQHVRSFLLEPVRDASSTDAAYQFIEVVRTYLSEGERMNKLDATVAAAGHEWLSVPVHWSW